MQATQGNASTMLVLMYTHSGIDHLIAQCPQNPNAPKITPLNLVEVTNRRQIMPPIIPMNVATQLMLQDSNHVLKERDTTSIA